MTYIVGYGPHNNDRGAVELACQLARSESHPVRVVTVVPQGWGTPVASGTDREFREWAAEEGEAGVAEAIGDLARHPDVEGTAAWISGRSVPHALLDQAEASDARMIVVGSRADAKPGRIRLSSKTDRLVHSSPVPVAIAPKGYRTGERVERVTVGFRDDDASWSLLTRVAEICTRTSARLRVTTFVVAPQRRPAAARLSHAETQVIDLWNAQASTAQQEAEAHLSEMGFPADRLEFGIAHGKKWSKAIDSLEWRDGDVLAIGSSATMSLARVFLGSSGSKILRAAPVPVVVVPGSDVA